MGSLELRRAVMMAMAGANNPIYYTKYELTGDTTLYQLLSSVNYRVHYNDVYIKIRANGSVAPLSGAYTMNNYFVYFKNGILYSGYHRYMNGRVAPDSFILADVNEKDQNLSIQNRILVSNNSASTSCLGTTGDNVVIMEIPLDFDKYLGID